MPINITRQTGTPNGGEFPSSLKKKRRKFPSILTKFLSYKPTTCFPLCLLQKNSNMPNITSGDSHNTIHKTNLNQEVNLRKPNSAEHKRQRVNCYQLSCLWHYCSGCKHWELNPMCILLHSEALSE